ADRDSARDCGRQPPAGISGRKLHHRIGLHRGRRDHGGMKQFDGKVAVVTGAASGIGRELAVACARRGMKLVLADVDVDGLSATKDLMPSDIAVRTTHCDVSSFEAVQSLADLAFGEFGSVHLVFNNAGVAALGPVWSAPPED